MRSVSRSFLLPSFLAASSLTAPTQDASNRLLPVHTVYQYPLNSSIENIAVRSSGELLVTLIDVPHVDQINPFDSHPLPTTVATAPNATGVFGIVEIDADRFAVVSGNISQAAWAVWNLDFSCPSETRANFSKLATFPKTVTFPNGVSRLPSNLKKPDNMLVGDIATGAVYHVDTTAGAISLAFNNSLTAPAPAPDPTFGRVGVNGIHVRGSDVYFANTGQNILARMPIHSDGKPAGATIVVAHGLKDTQFDDFALGTDFAYMVTGFGDSIQQASLDGQTKDNRIIAGKVNTTTIAEPTSAAFGRTEKDKHVLYVVAGGGLAAPINGNITVGAQVLAIDLSGL